MQSKSGSSFRVVAEILLLGLIVGAIVIWIIMAGLNQATDIESIAVYNEMRAPVVRVLTKFTVFSVEIKPEYREPFPYSGQVKTAERSFIIPRGQKEIWVEPGPGEIFLSDVWVEGGKVHCKAPARTRPIKDPTEGVRKECDSWWKAAIGTTDRLDRTSWDGVIALGGKYRLNLIPVWSLSGSQLITIRYPYLGKLDKPFRYTLRKMTPLSDADKVIEKTTERGYLGTGMVGYSGSILTRKYYSRRSGNPRELSWNQAAKTQTIFLTNWHLIKPILDKRVYLWEDEYGSVWKAQAIVGTQAYIQLNPNGRWIEVRVGEYSIDYDLAQLWVSPAIPKSPAVNWLPAGQKPVLGETAYIVGHPLGIADDTVGQGLIDAVNHIPKAGETLWGRARYLLTIPAEQGSSGSPAYVIRDHTPYVIGILHAGYGSVYGKGAWDPEGTPADSLDGFRLRSVDVSDPNTENIISRKFISSPYFIIVSVDDIAQFVAEAGQVWEGLTDRFSY